MVMIVNFCRLLVFSANRVRKRDAKAVRLRTLLSTLVVTTPALGEQPPVS